MSKKQYTDQQKAFVNALFTEEVEGDFELAKQIAGYSENTPVSQILKGVKELIVDAANYHMAANLPQALMAVQDVLRNPHKIGAKTQLDAANAVFDRGGLTKKVEKDDGPTRVQAILIMPPKQDDVMLDVTPALERVPKKTITIDNEDIEDGS